MTRTVFASCRATHRAADRRRRHRRARRASPARRWPAPHDHRQPQHRRAHASSRPSSRPSRSDSTTSARIFPRPTSSSPRPRARRRSSPAPWSRLRFGAAPPPDIHARHRGAPRHRSGGRRARGRVPVHDRRPAVGRRPATSRAAARRRARPTSLIADGGCPLRSLAAHARCRARDPAAARRRGARPAGRRSSRRSACSRTDSRPQEVLEFLANDAHQPADARRRASGCARRRNRAMPSASMRSRRSTGSDTAAHEGLDAPSARATVERFEEVSALLAARDLAGGKSARFRDLSVEYARLEPVAARFREFRRLEAERCRRARWPRPATPRCASSPLEELARSRDAPRGGGRRAHDAS